jgi:hypothetical protein
MSATKRHVKAECGRMFAAIPLISSLDDAGKREIADTLMEHCQSDEHVTEVLKFFAENALDWRNPVAELVAIARKTETPECAPPGCEACDLGPDPFTGAQRWAAHVSAVRNGYDVAERCSCRRGRWLARKETAAPKVAELAAKQRRSSQMEKLADAAVE